jgi:hypothetical protein
MKFYEETTKWETSTPNHTYLLSDDKSKAFAYVRAGTRAVFKFKAPIKLDLRGRTFKAVPNTFGYAIETEEVTKNPQWKIKGSKGDIYLVEKTDSGYNCTCSGFRFRGRCKHIESVQ